MSPRSEIPHTRPQQLPSSTPSPKRLSHSAPERGTGATVRGRPRGRRSALQDAPPPPAIRWSTSTTQDASLLVRLVEAAARSRTTCSVALISGANMRALVTNRVDDFRVKAYASTNGVLLAVDLSEARR